MIALYDQNGHARSWLNDNSSLIYNLYGHVVAFIEEGGIYDVRGRHVAWWYGDKIRDPHGNVLLVTRDVAHLEVRTPLWRTSPTPPTLHVSPTHPTFDLRPIQPIPSRRWIDASQFLDVLEGLAVT